MEIRERVLLIAPLEDGALEARPSDMPDLAPVEAMGFAYGSALELPEKGVTIARGRVLPGMEVPNHAGPNRYVLYVLSGYGNLILFDNKGNRTEVIAFAPGTLIDFPPNAPHGWVVEGEQTFEWLGVDLA